MIRKLSILIFCLIAVCGCSARLASLLRGSIGQPEVDFRSNAKAFEKQGELQQALLAWRTAARLAPDDPTIPAKIRTLEDRIADAVQAHFKSGIESYQAGDYAQARREFLTVLRLSPEHQKALYYLKIRLNGVDQPLYKVQRGDSFIKIATEHYKDPTKAYTIADFNGLDPDKPLLIDTPLLLPVLKPEQLLPRKDLDELMQRAQSALDQKQYQEALAVCEKIREENPILPRIQGLADAGRLGLAKQFIEQKDYPAALEQLEQISPGFAGRKQAIRKARRYIRRQAVDGKIRSAQARFDHHAYAGAIAICLEVLRREPNDVKAQALLHASRYRLGKQQLDQGKEALAIENLSTLGKDYHDTAQLLILAHARMNARAEEFYRKGVKYFLNEDLERAIESWKKALGLNPDHPKARQDMENALRLLDKWRGLGKDGDPKAESTR
jgi:tetratricopeptide (TPR) repeat protein